jgi:hypothetical protein
MLRMQLAGFRGVMRGMKMMPVCGMRMMRRFVVIAALVVMGRVTMMLRRLRMMMGGLFVVFRELMG